jgi:epoxyqueuosine reductase
MKTLLHICCATCAIGAIKALRDDGADVVGFFYNPNIHPFLEFRKRIKAVKVLRESVPFPVIMDEDYGLGLWIREVFHADPAARCQRCYDLRLRRTAEVALAHGCDSFTTTLLISKHQNHEALRESGERIGEEAGVPFLYRDFRPCNDAAHEEAKKRHLYRQQYCGCCMSEYERFKDTTREIYKPDLIARREPDGKEWEG